MAFSIQVEGLDQLMNKFNELDQKALGIAAQGLYEGAGVVADAVSGAVQGIATEPFRYAKGGQTRKPSPEEKAIVDGAKKGVAKFRKNGVSVQTSVGMQNAGYAKLGNKIKPIPQIANAINSGTSFMQKQPFMRKAFSKSQGAAEAAIENKIKELIDEIDIG